MDVGVSTHMMSVRYVLNGFDVTREVLCRVETLLIELVPLLEKLGYRPRRSQTSQYYTVLKNGDRTTHLQVVEIDLTHPKYRSLLSLARAYRRIEITGAGKTGEIRGIYITELTARIVKREITKPTNILKNITKIITIAKTWNTTRKILKEIEKIEKKV